MVLKYIAWEKMLWLLIIFFPGIFLHFHERSGNDTKCNNNILSRFIIIIHWFPETSHGRQWHTLWNFLFSQTSSYGLPRYFSLFMQELMYSILWSSTSVLKCPPFCSAILFRQIVSAIVFPKVSRNFGFAYMQWLWFQYVVVVRIWALNYQWRICTYSRESQNNPGYSVNRAMT